MTDLLDRLAGADRPGATAPRRRAGGSADERDASTDSFSDVLARTADRAERGREVAAGSGSPDDAAMRSEPGRRAEAPTHDGRDETDAAAEEGPRDIGTTAGRSASNDADADRDEGDGRPGAPAGSVTDPDRPAAATPATATGPESVEAAELAGTTSQADAAVATAVLVSTGSTSTTGGADGSRAVRPGSAPGRDTPTARPTSPPVVGAPTDGRLPTATSGATGATGGAPTGDGSATAATVGDTAADVDAGLPPAGAVAPGPDGAAPAATDRAAARAAATTNPAGADVPAEPSAPADGTIDGVEPAEPAGTAPAVDGDGPGTPGTELLARLDRAGRGPVPSGEATADTGSGATAPSTASSTVPSNEATAVDGEAVTPGGDAPAPERIAVSVDGADQAELPDGVGAERRPVAVPTADAATGDTGTARTAPATRLAEQQALREAFDQIERHRLSSSGTLELEIRTERFGALRIEAVDGGEGVQLSLRSDDAGRDELADLARELRERFGDDAVDVDAGERDGRGRPTGDGDDPATDRGDWVGPDENRATHDADGTATDLAGDAPVERVDLRL